jgi:hypothetical protein
MMAAVGLAYTNRGSLPDTAMAEGDRDELGKRYPIVPINDKPSRLGELVKVLQTLLGRSG